MVLILQDPARKSLLTCKFSCGKKKHELEIIYIIYVFTGEYLYGYWRMCLGTVRYLGKRFKASSVKNLLFNHAKRCNHCCLVPSWGLGLMG